MHPVCFLPVYFCVSAFASCFLHPLLSAQDTTGTNREERGRCRTVGRRGVLAATVWYLLLHGLLQTSGSLFSFRSGCLICRCDSGTGQGALGIISSQGPGKVTTKAKFLVYKSISSVLAGNANALGKEVCTLCSSSSGHSVTA